MSTQARNPARLTRRRWMRIPASYCSSGGCGASTLQLALHVLERDVANVGAMHHVDHVLGDVLGVIADALERTDDPHDIEMTADGARILHHEGNALSLNRLVLLVDQVILAGDLQS